VIPIANVVQNPSITSDFQSFSEDAEFYCCLARDPDTDVENTLDSGDLIPSRGADSGYPSRTFAVTNVSLEGGGSITVPDPGSTFAAFDVSFYGAQSNAKWLEMEQANEEILLTKFNRFARDGSGWEGTGWVTAITVVNEPFHYTLTYSPQDMTRINS
jgi:hypothetical protein